MKKIFALIISSYFIISGFSQEIGEEKWREIIKTNEIKTQTQWNHKYKDGKPQKEGYINVVKEFDENGNLIKEFFYKGGIIYQRMFYEYDESGNRTEFFNTKKDDGEDKILYKQTITYNNKNQKVLERRHDGLEQYKLTYEYDGDNLKEIKKYSQLGELQQTRKFKKDGNITTITVYSGNNSAEGKVINKYDSRGNLVETQNFKPVNLLKDKFVYKFDDQNRLIEKAKYNPEEFIYKENYKFNKMGNLVEVVREEPQNNEFVNNKYNYDEEGNLMEEQWYDKHPEKYSKKTYHYNKKGILTEVEVFYALYNYRIMYKYKYEFF